MHGQLQSRLLKVVIILIQKVKDVGQPTFPKYYYIRKFTGRHNPAILFYITHSHLEYERDIDISVRLVYIYNVVWTELLNGTDLFLHSFSR